MTYRIIVVGVAGTDTAWQALAWAADEAAVTGGRLVVCRGCPPGSPLARYPVGVPLSVLELSDPRLARAVGAIRTRLGGQRVAVRIGSGIDAVRLLSGAVCDADLLVVGAPEHTGWVERRSTIHRLLGRVPCPMVVVRATTGAARAAFAGHVVVGVDGGEPAGAVLEFAFGYAAAHGLPLVAVHASADASDDVWFTGVMPQPRVAAEPAALMLLAEQVAPWSYKYPDVALKRAVYSGRPLPALLRAAAGARLLVLGTRGRGPAFRAVRGSVSHGVIDLATGPVAVLPAGGHQRAAGAYQPQEAWA